MKEIWKDIKGYEGIYQNTPYLDGGNIREIWNRHRKGNGDYGILLWKCLCYVTWYDQYFDKTFECRGMK